jgi:hypothetical protein
MGTRTGREEHQLTAKDKRCEQRDEVGPIWIVQ